MSAEGKLLFSNPVAIIELQIPKLKQGLLFPPEMPPPTNLSQGTLFPFEMPPLTKVSQGLLFFELDAVTKEWKITPAFLDQALGKEFIVGPHEKMPTPRLGRESHHGIMSRWMEEHYSDYNQYKAPGVLMDVPNHTATKIIFEAWKKERGENPIDWGKVTELEIRQLAERMFDAAEVPKQVRTEYYAKFDEYVKTLKKK